VEWRKENRSGIEVSTNAFDPDRLEIGYHAALHGVGLVGRSACSMTNEILRLAALKALARHPSGCAEEVLAGGFSIAELSGLVIDGYAALQRKRVDISGRERTVLWLQITEAGQQAIAE
jgi:hypothetical protein